MRLQTLALIFVIVAAAVLAGLWFFTALFSGPGGWLALIPAAAVAVLLVGVIVARLRSREDDHYDNIEK